MQRVSGRSILLACVAGLLSVGTGATMQTDDDLIAVYRQNVAGYVALHERLERALPALVPSDHPHIIFEAQRALAAAIAAERTAARQGDVFSPRIAVLLKDRIRHALRGRDVTMLLTELYWEEHSNVSTLRPEINKPFPEGASFEVPWRILAALPALPDDVEYRLVGVHLVLWDSHANLIVDYILNVLPEST